MARCVSTGQTLRKRARTEGRVVREGAEGTDAADAADAADNTESAEAESFKKSARPVRLVSLNPSALRTDVSSRTMGSSQVRSDTDLEPEKILGRSREPALFKQLAAAWPALSRWTPAYLCGLAGDREVEVVVGDRESNKTQVRRMQLAHFFDQLLAGTPGTPPLYLKEFDLFAEFPVLLADVDLQRLEQPGADAYRRAWISQTGARTGFHYDLFDNTLTQIHGRKTVTLVPPSRSRDMYPSPKFDAYARLSQVDGFAPDPERFPRYARALADAQEFELHPGDSLYIPRNWWHKALSLTPSISMAGFMVTRAQMWLVAKPEQLRLYLHQLGLYKRGRCTCHTAAPPSERK